MSGSHVHFRVDGRRSHDRILTWQPPQRGDTVHLSLLSPRGLALLGLAAGDSVAYRTDRARTEFLEVDEVWNPERTETAPTTDAPRLHHPVALEIPASNAAL
jgi:transcription elongation GreA/GreB family factor